MFILLLPLLLLLLLLKYSSKVLVVGQNPKNWLFVYPGYITMITCCAIFMLCGLFLQTTGHGMLADGSGRIGLQCFRFCFYLIKECKHWNSFKGNVGKTFETRGRAHNYGLFRVRRYHLELNWNELNRTECNLPGLLWDSHFMFEFGSLGLQVWLG